MNEVILVPVYQKHPGDSKRNERDQFSHHVKTLDCSSTSRTQVTIFSRGGGYRFLVCSRKKLCLHAFFLIQTSSPPRHLGLVGAHSGGRPDGFFRLGR